MTNDTKSPPLVFATLEEIFNELASRQNGAGDYVFTLGSRLLIGCNYGPEDIYELGKELILIADAETNKEMKDPKK